MNKDVRQWVNAYTMRDGTVIKGIVWHSEEKCKEVIRETFRKSTVTINSVTGVVTKDIVNAIPTQYYFNLEPLER